MVEFFCQQCADKSDESESLSLGARGIRECCLCGRKVDAMSERYSIFREGAEERFKSRNKIISKCSHVCDKGGKSEM